MIGGRIEALVTVPSGVTLTATNNGGGPSAVSITAGTYGLTELCAIVQQRLTLDRAPSAGAWTVALSTGASGTGKVTIAMTSGTYSITWIDSTLRDLLGFGDNIAGQTTSTGTQMRGLWMPRCPLNLDGDPDAAPRVTDLRTTTSPTGVVVGHVGTSMYRHRNLTWSHVERRYVQRTAEVTTSESLEQWLDDTQFGNGLSWFSVANPFQVYWDNAGSDRPVGFALTDGNGPAAGWSLTGINSIEAAIRKRTEGWLGMWTVAFPQIVSVG